MTSGTRSLVASVFVASVVAMVSLAAADAPIFDGRPAFKEGSNRSYFVWKDGDQWHVRWTTLGAMHRFTGSVIAEGGEIHDFKRVDVEVERKVIAPGRAPHVVRGPRGRVRGVASGRAPVVAEKVQDKIDKEDDHTIRFAARTEDDIDGFDFKVKDDVKVLRFRLEIDGASRPADVEVGRNNRHPDNNPFFVNLR